ncbi:MAG: hypothetical protein ACOZCO_00725 [Bacteroidota bacterium]
MKELFIIVFCLFTSSVFSQKQVVEYEGIMYIFETRNGLFDGEYKSFYPNKKLKAEGTFKNNQRVGKWRAYDSTGVMKTERDYKNNFEFTRVFPELPQDGPAKLLSEPVYVPKYNSDGFIENFPLKERQVMISKRIWRFIPSATDHWSALYGVLYESAKNKEIKIYSSKDDQFRKVITSGNIDSLMNCKRIVFKGYKIKEDWFFDTDRMISETRIIGICPVFYCLDTKIPEDLCWFYFPECRKVLSGIQVKNQNRPSCITTMDDLFFYRFFESEIYKESNIHDRSIADYCKGEEIQKEALRIELSLKELEHDAWLMLTN